MKEVVLFESQQKARKRMTDFLVQKGYRIRPFTDLRSAVTFIDENPAKADVAITEILHPLANTQMLVDFLRDRESVFTLLAMTACLPRDPFQMIRQGLDTLFQKPLDLEVLETTIRNLTRERLCRPGIRCESYGFLSDTCIQSGFRKHLETRLKQYGFDATGANTIVLAVDEIFTNAVLHGNYGLGSRKENPETWDRAFHNIQTAIEDPSSPEGKYYRPLIQKKVYVDLKFLHKNLLITIRDQGPGFDWKAHLEDGMAHPSPAISGFGITIAKKVMDQVFYNDQGNEVTMTVAA
ncbi:MAG: ATP-binding protein [Planctomycetota bacterium]|jgi:anti-sigma regulatory factor (Ser/Thr protein kinase)